MDQGDEQKPDPRADIKPRRRWTLTPWPRRTRGPREQRAAGEPAAYYFDPDEIGQTTDDDQTGTW